MHVVQSRNLEDAKVLGMARGSSAIHAPLQYGMHVMPHPCWDKHTCPSAAEQCMQGLATS